MFYTHVVTAGCSKEQICHSLLWGLLCDLVFLCNSELVGILFQCFKTCTYIRNQQNTLQLDMLLRDLCKYTDMGHDYLIILILFQLYLRKFVSIWQTACKAGRQKVIMPKRNRRSSVNPGLRDTQLIIYSNHVSPKYTNPKSRKQIMRMLQKSRMYGYIVIMVLWMRQYASTILHIPHVPEIISLLVRAGRNLFRS